MIGPFNFTFTPTFAEFWYKLPDGPVKDCLRNELKALQDQSAPRKHILQQHTHTTKVTIWVSFCGYVLKFALKDYGSSDATIFFIEQGSFPESANSLWGRDG
jgi:hypothetical protein